MPHILFTPGPCMTSETVRQAAAMPDLNHREPEYRVLIHEVRARLLNLYPLTVNGWVPFLLAGSGTLAVEAMLTSCIGTGPVLVLENGYYSRRIREVLAIHRIPFTALEHGWLEAWDFERIERALEDGFEAVVGTHNETTTGRLNDIAKLGAACKRVGARCLIDAMSSFGADEIDFTDLDAVAASSNKCLHGIPGVGFVLVNEMLAGMMSQVARRSYYMSLPMYQGEDPPLTPPVPAVAAMRQALREFPAGGAAGRRADYLLKIAYLRDQLSDRGFSFAITNEESSCTLLTTSIPTGFTLERWFKANLQEGFVLYACKGELRERFFQVSVMGEVTMDQLRQWIHAVDRILAI